MPRLFWATAPGTAGRAAEERIAAERGLSLHEATHGEALAHGSLAGLKTLPADQESLASKAQKRIVKLRVGHRG